MAGIRVIRAFWSSAYNNFRWVRKGLPQVLEGSTDPAVPLPGQTVPTNPSDLCFPDVSSRLEVFA